MTVWKAGMRCICIDARHVRNGVRMLLVEGQIYTIEKVEGGDCPVFGTGVGLHLKGVASQTTHGWLSDRFRPLIDQADDAELIARIKNCKPAGVPHAPLVSDGGDSLSSAPAVTVAAKRTHAADSSLQALDNASSQFTDTQSFIPRHAERNS